MIKISIAAPHRPSLTISPSGTGFQKKTFYWIHTKIAKICFPALVNKCGGASIWTVCVAICAKTGFLLKRWDCMCFLLCFMFMLGLILEIFQCFFRSIWRDEEEEFNWSLYFWVLNFKAHFNGIFFIDIFTIFSHKLRISCP